MDGVVDENNGEDWEVKPEPNGVHAIVGELKFDSDEPNAEGPDVEKMHEDELAPNARVWVDPNKWGVVDAVEEPKGEMLGGGEDPNPALPKGVEANGLEALVEANGDDWPKAGEGVERGAPKPIAPADWPAGFGPPENYAK